MQWLINLLMEWYGLYGGYHDRGSYPSFDFRVTDFTTDNTWRELDLSTIIPEHTKAAAIRLRIRSAIIGQRIKLRPHGTTSDLHTCCGGTTVANVDANSNPVIGVSSDRKIDYKIPDVVWGAIFLNVRGWWLRPNAV